MKLYLQEQVAGQIWPLLILVLLQWCKERWRWIGRGWSSEVRSDIGYILKLVPSGLAVTRGVWQKPRKVRRETKDDSKAFGLSNWMNRVNTTEMKGENPAGSFGVRLRGGYQESVWEVKMQDAFGIKGSVPSNSLSSPHILWFHNCERIKPQWLLC